MDKQPGSEQPLENEEFSENFEDVLKLADAWEAEEPPPGLARQTLEKIPEAGLLNWLDSVAIPIRNFFEARPRGAGVLAMAAACMLVLIVISPTYYRGWASGDVTACRLNQETVAQVLEIYHQDHGAYPQTLEQLLPEYLKSIPPCPSAGEVTYIEKSRLSADSFVIVCAGHHHPRLGQDQPQTSSEPSP